MKFFNSAVEQIIAAFGSCDEDTPGVSNGWRAAAAVAHKRSTRLDQDALLGLQADLNNAKASLFLRQWENVAEFRAAQDSLRGALDIVDTEYTNLIRAKHNLPDDYEV